MSNRPPRESDPPTEPTLDRYLTPRIRNLLLTALLLLSPALWLAIKPLVWARELECSLTPGRATGAIWSLEWQQGHDGPWNGQWINLASLGAIPQTLEIRLPGKSATPSPSAPGFHLYEVTGGPWRLSGPDLKAALAKWQADPSLARAEGLAFEGNWIPGVGDSGGVFCDSPGTLRLPIPADAVQAGIRFRTEKTPRGSDIECLFAGDRKIFNTRADQWQPLEISLQPAQASPGATATIRCPLPAYSIASLRLSRQSDDGVPIRISGLTLHTRLFGLSLPDRTLPPPSDPALPPGAAAFTSPSVLLSGPIKTTISVHLAGLAFIIGGLLALWHSLWAGLRALDQALHAANRAFHHWRGERLLPATPRPHFGPAFWSCLALISLAHFWMAFWAPLLFPPDSIDYIINAQRLYDTSSFAHFGAWRLPGTSLILYPFIAIFSHPERALALAQAVGGILVALMCHDVARRFVPAPLAALTMLWIGLDPTGLVWERHIMSEAPMTFATSLWMWLLVRLCDPTPTTFAKRALWALALGLVCGFAPLIRGNAQVMAILAPVGVAAALWSLVRPTRALGLGAITLAASLSLLVPWVAHIHQQYGRPRVMIGGGFANLAFTWNANLMDVNQTRLYDAQTLELVRQQELARNDLFGFVPRLNASPRLQQSPLLHSWIQQDERCAIAANESRARHGSQSLRAMLHGAGTILLGVRPEQFASTRYWSRSYFGILPEGQSQSWDVDVPRLPYPIADRPRLEQIHARTTSDIAFLKTDPSAKWFERWYSLFDHSRFITGLLFLAGGLAALREWNCTLLTIWGLSFATILALAYLVFGGETRYVEPLYPAMSVMAAFGLGRIIQSVTGPRHPLPTGVR